MPDTSGGSGVDVGTDPYGGNNQDTPPPTSTSTSPSTGGNAIGNFVGSLGQYFPGGGGSAQQMAMIPAMAAAAQQYANASQYTNRAQGYASQLDPYGSQRAGAQQALNQLQANPMQYIQNSPNYQASLQSGLGAVNRGDMASTGGGNITADDISFGSQLGQKTYNDLWSQLSQEAGVGIGPQAAAGMLQTGLTGSINSQNAALAAMLYPWAQSTSPGSGATPYQQAQQNQSGGPGGPSPGGMGNMTAQQAAQLEQQLGLPPGSLTSMIQNPLGLGPGSYNGMQTAPPGYTSGSDLPTGISNNTGQYTNTDTSDPTYYDGYE